MAIVYGNCQAEPLRRILDAAPGFTYPTLALPPVHLMRADEADALRRLLPHIGLFIAQPVRDGYRELPLGSEQMGALVNGRVIGIVQLFYRGLYPFQAYVRHRGYEAPRSEYDDLRFLYCAAKGFDARHAACWLREYEPPRDVVAQVAAESRAELGRREQQFGLEVRAAARIDDPELHGQSFYTINHPRLPLLRIVAEGICRTLGLPFELRIKREPLSRILTPLEPAVCTALGLSQAPRPGWQLDGASYSTERLLALHLRRYAADASIVSAGIEQHGQEMVRLGLGV